jgi:universal stress protein A
MPGIVLTTDLSAESRRAFAPTRELARKLGLPVVLLAVVEDIPMEALAGGIPVAWPDREQQKRDFAAKLAEFARELGGGVRTEVIDGLDAALAIVDYCKQEKADFIAMASHGRSGLRRLLMGSVAEAVLRRSTVPVIVFPPAVEG